MQHVRGVEVVKQSDPVAQGDGSEAREVWLRACTASLIGFAAGGEMFPDNADSSARRAAMVADAVLDEYRTRFC